MAEARRSGPGPLGVPTFEGVPEASQAAWWADLRRWVEEIRLEYWHLWPDPPPGIDTYGRSRRKPFPRCWMHHRGLASDLAVLRTWHDGLREGIDWAGGVQGWHEWRCFLERVADHLQVVEQLCTPIHRDALVEPARAG